jgi:catechol 2,3-dioxygenase-like lactoylglutathione lyase family enzyme
MDGGITAMRTHLAHMQLNVHPQNMPFYNDLMAFLGWTTIFGNDEMLGVAGKNGESLWFAGQVKEASNDYDGPGMNHLAIGTETQADVDAVAAYLTQHDVELLFETPRHRAEFSGSADRTYYQVMFETPDRILVEVVYTGPKSA